MVGTTDEVAEKLLTLLQWSKDEMSDAWMAIVAYRLGLDKSMTGGHQLGWEPHKAYMLGVFTISTGSIADCASTLLQHTMSGVFQKSRRQQRGGDLFFSAVTGDLNILTLGFTESTEPLEPRTTRNVC